MRYFFFYLLIGASSVASDRLHEVEGKFGLENRPRPEATALERSTALLAQLGNSNWHIRDAATKSLTAVALEAPKVVLPLLADAVRTPDLEVRRRIQLIVAHPQLRRNQFFTWAKCQTSERRKEVGHFDVYLFGRQNVQDRRRLTVMVGEQFGRSRPLTFALINKQGLVYRELSPPVRVREGQEIDFGFISEQELVNFDHVAIIPVQRNLPLLERTRRRMSLCEMPADPLASEAALPVPETPKNERIIPE